MKASTIVIIALIGLIAFLLLHPTDAEKKTAELKSAAEAATPPPPLPEPVTPPPPPRPDLSYQPKPPVLVSKKNLEVVRGTVAAVFRDGMIIDCTKSTVRIGTSLDDPKLKKQANEDESNNWGPLLVAQDENVHRMEWEPPLKATGRLYLKNHPYQFQSRPGDHVNIVAVPLAEMYSADSGKIPVYTMRFAVEGATGDNWMWQNKSKGTLLDR